MNRYKAFSILAILGKTSLKPSLLDFFNIYSIPPIKVICLSFLSKKKGDRKCANYNKSTLEIRTLLNLFHLVSLIDTVRANMKIPVYTALIKSESIFTLTLPIKVVKLLFTCGLEPHKTRTKE